MTNYVIINGVNSNTINGLGINELPPITKPQMRVQNEEIDGRDGDITTNLGYSAYDKTITIGLFGTGYDINDIVAFFNGEGTIVFSNEADKYYNFKILNQIDYVALQKFKSASITFHCQPFKYPLTETPLEIEYTYIEDEGESLTLNNTGESILKLDLKGQCKQDSTTGKNMLNNIAATGTWSGVTFTINDDKSITLNGTANDQTNLTIGKINFTSGETYTISGVTGFTDTTLQIYTSSTNAFPSGSRLQCYDGAVTKTAQADENCLVKLYIYGGVTYNNVTIYPMIVEGSTSGDYEPYTGKQPSPSPDFPQQIHEVSGDNEVVVCGKNLLGLTNGTYSNNGITAIVNNGEIKLSGTASGTSFVSIPLLQDIVLLNQTITLSANNISTGGDSLTEIRVYTSGTSYLACTYNTIDNSVVYTNKTDTYNRVQIRTSSGVSYNNLVLKPMLEKNNSHTTYEPYQSQTYELSLGDIKMRGIGTYEDYFVRNSGKNLFDKNNANILNANLNNDKITSSNPERVFWIECKPNTTYTIQKLVNSPFSRLTIADTPTEPQYGDSVYNLDGDAVATSLVHTTGANAKYMVCWFYNTSSTNYTMQEVLDSIMINEGSIALPYEPYGTGQWCKYNAIVEINVPTFTELISGTLFGTPCNYVQFAIGNVVSEGRNYLYYGDKIHYAKINNVEQYSPYGSYINNTNVVIMAGANDTLQDMNNKVSGSLLYYRLATPYLSLIEDNNLIEQLDNIQNAMSYEGTTNISQVNNDKPFIISAKALEQGSNEVVVNNIGNIYAKPLIALEGSGNVNIYLDNTQILQANVESKMNIDIAQLEAYNPDTSVLLNRQVIGNYNSMTIPSGESTIRIDGALDKATISNYTRWL